MAKKEKIKEATPKEAITNLTMFFKEYVMIGAPDGALGAAIKALDKQVRKNPDKIRERRNFRGDVIYKDGQCPVCFNDITSTHLYCNVCGQAIEWDNLKEDIKNDGGIL